MPEVNFDFARARQEIGDANSRSILLQGGGFRRKLRLAFDTNVYQLCANERVLDDTKIQEDGPWAGARVGRFVTVQGQYKDRTELECIFAICELGRRGDAEMIDLPIVTAERRSHPRRHGHFHGIERLDFGMQYTNYPVVCAKMQLYSSRLVQKLTESDPCFRDVANYAALQLHLPGKGQIKDVVAFMQADLADVDVFISLDGDFLRPFRQVEKKLRSQGIRSHAMTPSEFCTTANLMPIPFPDPDPRQAMGASPPNR